jgi:conjugative relaxase-like TrwC/TraI family protein
VRRGRGGVVRERAPGFVAAAYQHRTSRAQDPHLHTHVIVANMARGDDGAWRAIDGDLLLRTHRLAAGHLYQANLRAGLTASLGVEWGAVQKGMAEIAGIPTTALREFSTRRRQIERRLLRFSRLPRTNGGRERRSTGSGAPSSMRSLPAHRSRNRARVSCASLPCG